MNKKKTLTESLVQSLNEQEITAYSKAIGTAVHALTKENQDLYNKIYYQVASLVGADLIGNLRPNQIASLTRSDARIRLVVSVDFTDKRFDIEYGKQMSLRAVKDLSKQLEKLGLTGTY